jgi:eukaryotic-like serine/threonine-protein kinase
VSLTPGTRLGPYEVTAHIGSGGMGEVYRAKDTKLGRDVALKILPASFTTDPERVARFRREAQVLASLNHPHIAHIHGLDEANGTQFLVLELVDGESLDRRIARGPIPLDDALGIARQIAEALEAAHEKGIIHRDLKPANIALTTDGQVKVLDFGLAKAVETTAGSLDVANSPTITSPAMMTGIGVILGTAAYMSPEQAKGRAADKRSDVWAFGCVLYEMLTGRRAFAGEDVSDTLATVLKTTPDWSGLPTDTPPTIRTLLTRSLQKDPARRLPAIAVARFDIDDAFADATGGTPAAGPSRIHAGRREWLAWAIAGAVAVVATGVIGWVSWSREPAPEQQSLQFDIQPPPQGQFTFQQFGTAISPDGRFVVFAARTSATLPSLWVRPLDALTPRELPGTENGNGLFWSPDSHSIGFVSTGKLKRIDLVGGTPQVLADAPDYEGGSWSKDGVILFSTGGVIQRIPAAGGTVTPVTVLDVARKHRSHRYPHLLPDGRTFLFLVRSADPTIEGIYAATLDQPAPGPRLVASDAKAVYAPPYAGQPGRLLWMHDQTLMTQPFNIGRMRIEGDPAPVVDRVLENNARRAAFWTSNNGLLVYRSGSLQNLQATWVSKEGKERQPVGQANNYSDVRLSPDATRIALSVNEVNQDVFVFDIGRGVMSRLTFDAHRDFSPVWSPDGRQVAFTSDRDGLNQIYRKDAAGGQEERIQKSSTPQVVLDWSRDGRYILYQEQNPKTGWDLWVLPLEGDRKPIQFLATPFNEANATFSPDGKWIAYTSDESGGGRNEVYLRTFPYSPGQWQLSKDGGNMPRWRGDGKELFFRTPSNIFSVTLRSGPQRVEIDSPRSLFQWLGPAAWDVPGPGDRFLLLDPPGLNEGNASGILTVISNWPATLRR